MRIHLFIREKKTKNLVFTSNFIIENFLFKKKLINLDYNLKVSLNKK